MDLYILCYKRSVYIKILKWLSLSLLQYFSNVSMHRFTRMACETHILGPNATVFASGVFKWGLGISISNKFTGIVHTAGSVSTF